MCETKGGTFSKGASAPSVAMVRPTEVGFPPSSKGLLAAGQDTGTATGKGKGETGGRGLSSPDCARRSRPKGGGETGRGHLGVQVTPSPLSSAERGPLVGVPGFPWGGDVSSTTQVGRKPPGTSVVSSLFRPVKGGQQAGSEGFAKMADSPFPAFEIPGERSEGTSKGVACNPQDRCGLPTRVSARVGEQAISVGARD